MNDHIQVSYKLTTNEIIVPHIISIIWYGSSSKGLDVHPRSDCDLQIVLDSPNLEVIKQLGVVLEDFPHVDISIVYLCDMFLNKKLNTFQSGSKGIFFVHVLAQGKVLYGENIYKEMAKKINLDVARNSLIYTAREYLSRLRIMATHTPSDTMKFKKYSLKFMQDILVLKEVLKLSELSNQSYKDTVKNIKRLHKFNAETKILLNEIVNFQKNFTKEDMANLLYEYEVMMSRIIR